MEQSPPPIGHNYPPLSITEFLSGEDAPSDNEVLEALRERWIKRHPEIATLIARAEGLAANLERLPDTLDERSIEIALDLIAAIDGHDTASAAASSTLPAELKRINSQVADTIKSMAKGLEPLEKSLRALIADWLKRDLDARNADSSERVTTTMKLGRSGARAAITLEKTAIVEDVTRIPGEWLVPDIKRIEKAVVAGVAIPGIRSEDKPALRITWPDRVTAKAC